MLSTFLIVTAIGTAIFIWLWNRIPLWFSRPIRTLKVRELGLHVSGDDARWVDDWCHALTQGIESRLQHPRGSWALRCDVAGPRWRPQVMEGAAFGAGALHALTTSDWLALPAAVVAVRPQFAHAAYFGMGWCGALRFGKRVDDFLRIVQEYDPWWRFLSLDGYGFKFGLIDFPRDRRGLAHLHAIPGYYRRAAFQGVGRALYLAFLSDRRGLIEVLSEHAPQHDLDMIEGAAFAAAYGHPDQPRRVLAFARAMPYEWRAGAHLGMTLGFRARAIVDVDYLDKGLAGLPRVHADTIHHAIAMAGAMEEQIRRDHRAGAYGLWREKLSQRMQRERVWEPAYLDVPQERAEA